MKRILNVRTAVRAAILGVCLVGTFFHTSFGGTVVHDAARDLVLNAPCRAVFTNHWGGVWSFMHASTYNGARSLLPGVRTYPHATLKDQIGYPVVTCRGPARAESASPFFAVNASGMADTVNIKGAAYPAIAPGEMVVHPGTVYDTSLAAYRCAVLRFTIPRTGEYAVTAKVWNRNEGYIAAALFVNGQEVVARKAWVSSAKAITTNDFSRTSATYAAGDTIELSFDGNNTYFSNAAGLTFRIDETRPDGDIVDANALFAANKASAQTANPFTTDFGTWTSAYGISITNAGHMTRLALTNGYLRSVQGSGLVGAGYNDGTTLRYPFVTINTNSVPVTEWDVTSKLSTFYACSALWPNEFFIHPGAPMHVYHHVTPNRSGLYDIGFTARDMSKGTDAVSGQGVFVRLWQGGYLLAESRVSLERLPGGSSAFIRNVPVVPNVPLYIEVDPIGDNIACDGTGIFWGLLRTGDLPAAYNANAAFLDNMASAAAESTFTFNGAKWSFGLRNGGWNGAFSPFTTRQNTKFNGTCEGFGNNATTSPYITVNTSGRMLADADLDMSATAGRDAFLLHPASDFSAPTVRFTVPTSGLYAATMWIKDIDGRGNQDPANSPGVEGIILTNNCKACSALASSERVGAYEKWTNPFAYLTVKEVFLRKGQTVEFVVYNRGKHLCDLTAAYAWVELLQAAPKKGLTFILK